MSSARPRPSDPDPADHDAVDGLLLDDDHSGRGWRRRAVGMPKAQAMAQIPRAVIIQTSAPIGPARIIKGHIARCGSNDAVWLRRAIADRYLLEGGDPAVVQAFLAVNEDYRRRDVPRDPYGQPTNRVGRRNRGRR